jgi:hypothetical protein
LRSSSFLLQAGLILHFFPKTSPKSTKNYPFIRFLHTFASPFHLSQKARCPTTHRTIPIPQSPFPILPSWLPSTRASLTHTTDLAQSRFRSASASPVHTTDLTRRPSMHRKTGSRRLLVVLATSLSTTRLPRQPPPMIPPAATRHFLHHLLQPAALSLTTLLLTRTTRTMVA